MKHKNYGNDDDDDDSAAQDDSPQEQRALAFLQNEMTDAERAAFEAELTESESLRTAVEQSRAVLDTLWAANDAGIIQTVNALFAGAIERGASDLHIVPEQEALVVFLRVDGRLQETQRLSRSLQQAVVDRVKVMTDMHLSERRVPQDGRVSIRYQNRDYELRVTVFPQLHGERVTARLVNRSADDLVLGLDRLGLNRAQSEALRRIAFRPSGLIVVAGRADSGRTTLAYSLLVAIRDRAAAATPPTALNIMTIEDPVELSLAGISQASVHKSAGFTVESALRSLLRSAPDVAYAAHLRDLASAEAGIELAVTGRLFLTTLNTVSALSVVDRLRDMGIAPYLIGQAFAGAVGLRLLRKVCVSCVEEYRPAADDLKTAGLSAVEDGPFRRGRGCAACGGTGFKGRVPLCEALEADNRLRRRIAEGATADALWGETFGRSGGSLWDDARAKVRAGLTTVEEACWSLFDYPHNVAASGASATEEERGIFLLPALSDR